MSNNWRNFIREFLSYSRSDRNAIIILSSLTLAIICTILLLRTVEPKSDTDFSSIKRMIEEWEKVEDEKVSTVTLFTFDPNTITKEEIDSLSLPRSVKQNIIRYRKAGGAYRTASDVRKIYGMNDSLFNIIEDYIVIAAKKDIARQVGSERRVKELKVFDPNTINVSALLDMGFSSYQANNLVNYIKNGGSFKSPGDILKIYGIDSAMYDRLIDYIRIDKVTEKIEVRIMDTLKVELNTADSAYLVKLQGIGPVYARRILKYRNLLGGYYSKEQLKEIYNFPEETYIGIQNNLFVDTIQIRKIRLNFADYSELLRHPYINKEQVKALLRYRERNGPIKNLNEFQTLKGFDSETINRIRPYLTCR